MVFNILYRDSKKGVSLYYKDKNGVITVSYTITYYKEVIGDAKARESFTVIIGNNEVEYIYKHINFDVVSLNSRYEYRYKGNMTDKVKEWHYIILDMLREDEAILLLDERELMEVEKQISSIIGAEDIFEVKNKLKSLCLLKDIWGGGKKWER